MKDQSRRSFIRTSLGGAAGLAILPSIIPARLFGADAPSKKINVCQIGCGRMGRSDMGNVLKESLARVVCDYIAGMTDNFIYEQHDKYCGPASSRTT